ncbi:unnamed protein product [Rotaria sp. Silwood1]|nr:unnamed protein product [Rotaria sp. Silwood1]CAF4850105.1 unnamed protein product [Rotaria sp. Silwood1]
MSTTIVQDTLTVGIDIGDIIQNNPRLNNDVLPLILAKFRSIVPNANEVPEDDLKKEIQRKLNMLKSKAKFKADHRKIESYHYCSNLITVAIKNRKVNNTAFKQSDLDTSLVNFNNPTTVPSSVLAGFSTVFQQNRSDQSNCCQARKRIKTVQTAATGPHSTCSDDESFLKYSLRDRSKLIKIQYDYMTYYESSEDDDDDGSPDDALLSNVKLLEFMRFKDKYNITDDAIRVLNQLESIHGSCPTLYHLKKLRATLNKNIPIKKCDQGAYLDINDAIKLLIHSDPSVLDNTDNQKLHVKHNMDGTTIGTSTNFFMSTITCIESGAKQQTAPNVIPLGQFKFDKENRAEIERVIPDDFINTMEKNYMQVIPDILHMKLRISDTLLAEIISLISVTNTIAERPQHLKNVMTFLKQRAKDTRTNHKFTLTRKNEIEVSGRLNSQMHEHFLRDLPLSAIMKDNQKAFFIKKLCNDFFDLMRLYNRTDINKNLKQQSINWCERFKSLFGADAVTIYIHVLGNHAFEFHQQYDNLGLYSLQGNEKFNGVTTKDFFMSTNKRNFNIQLLHKRIRLRLLDIALRQGGLTAITKLFFNWNIKDTISAQESSLNKLFFLKEDTQRVYLRFS